MTVNKKILMFCKIRSDMHNFAMEANKISLMKILYNYLSVLFIMILI